jgi:hypothetical protein
VFRPYPRVCDRLPCVHACNAFLVSAAQVFLAVLSRSYSWSLTEPVEWTSDPLFYAKNGVQLMFQELSA